jgi:hypothetical protein
VAQIDLHAPQARSFMHLKMENGAPHSPTHIVWGLIAILAIIGARIFSWLLPFAPPCIFRTITGIPCLTCGGSHCIVALSQLNPLASFLYNPLIMLSLVAMMLFSLGHGFAFIFRRRLAFTISNGEKRTLRLAIILLIAVNWAYLIISAT